jgi:hypothetical protein
MRITYNNEDFDLPKDFRTAVDLSSPLLTDRGEMTAPFTLPPSPKNLRLVGHSNRLDIYYKPITDLAVIVQDGVYCNPCLMTILSASKTNGIQARIYLDSSYFYGTVDGVMLSALPWPVMSDFNEITQQFSIDYLIYNLRQQYLNPTHESIFTIAPVLTTQKYKYRYSYQKWTGVFDQNNQRIYQTITIDVENNFMLNAFEKWKAPLSLSFQVPCQINRFEAEFPQQVIIDDNLIDLAKGYGMTPFVKLRAVIDMIFTSYGYSFEHRSIEDTLNEYGDNICLYNNIADAIYNGELRFSRLMPEVDIKTFLAKIEVEFCGRFLINEISKTASFVFLGYSVSANAVASADLSQYLTEEPEMGQPEFKTILLQDSSENEKPDIDKKNTEILEFKFMKTKVVRDTYYYDDINWLMADVEIECIEGGAVIHKNSTIIADGEKIEENGKFSDILFLYVNNLVEKNAIANPTYPITYKSTYNMFYPSADIAVIQSLYSNYQTFMQHSNVKVSALFKFPSHVLHKLVYDFPYILSGTKVLIENISTQFGVSESEREDAVTFRTTRPFADRDD